MARDYRPRQEKMLDSHSARQTRHDKRSGRRSLWLSMLLVLALFFLGFWVVTHFASFGIKSSEKAALTQAQNAAASAEFLLPDGPIETHQEFKAESQVSSASLPRDKEPLDWLREPTQPSSSVSSLAKETVDEESNAGIFVDALPMPEAAKLYADPEITFYGTMNDFEVIPDDTTPISVALDTPKYLLAGAFFSKEAAQRALNQLSLKGQKLFMRETWSKSRNRAVYVLYTAPYTNRLELNARKNELRVLNAGVMEKDYQSEATKQTP
ncbi:SPOR domain-containing protein [Thiosulfatimonas sediminis]|nr:SPOR domain-containing protein [Thiosulfatimonas sediminis]